MVLGCYYLTMIHEGLKGTGKVFTDVDEALMAYSTGELALEAPCKIRMTRVIDGVEHSRLVETTIGRVIFNEAIPQDMGMQKRVTVDDMFKFEIDEVVGKKQLAKIVDTCYRTHGVTVTANMLDDIKALGYKYSTRAALTVSVADITVPEEKKQILADADAQVQQIERRSRSWPTPTRRCSRLSASSSAAVCPRTSATPPSSASGSRRPTTSPSRCWRRWRSSTPST